jgi:hypothetical protein
MLVNVVLIARRVLKVIAVRNGLGLTTILVRVTVVCSHHRVL